MWQLVTPFRKRSQAETHLVASAPVVSASLRLLGGSLPPVRLSVE